MILLCCAVPGVAADTVRLAWQRIGLPSREQVKGIEQCGDGLMLVTGVDAYTVRDSTVLPVLEGLPHRSVTDVRSRGTVLDVATSSGGVFRSTDNGLRWLQQPLPGTDRHVLRFATTSNRDFCLMASGTLLYRKPGQHAWVVTPTPDSIPTIRDIIADGPRLVVVTDSGGVYAHDASKRWSMIARMPQSAARALVATKGGVLIAALDTVLYRLPRTFKQPITKIADLPADRWLSISLAKGSVMLAGKGRRIINVDIATGATSELPVPGSPDDRIGAIYWDGTTVLAGIDRGSGGLYTMRLDVPIWQSVSLSTTKNADVTVHRIVEHNGTVAVCMLRSGLFVMDSALQRAESRHQGIRSSALATLHTLSRDHYVTSRTAGVFRVSQCGGSVERITSALPTGEGFAAAAMQDELLVSSGRLGMWRTANSGRRWIPCRYPDSSAYVDRLDVLGTSLIASARDRSWISTDRGTSWRRHRVLSDTSMLRWTASKGSIHLLGTTSASYIRRDEAAEWERIITPYSNETQHRFGNAAVQGSAIVLGTKGAVLLSRDAGYTWTPIDITPATFASFVALANNVLYVVTDRGELLRASLP